MRFGVVSVIYLVVGVLVAAGTIGDERDYFNDLDDIEAIFEMLLAVVLWPLLLLGVSLEIDAGNGGADAGNGGGNGDSGGDSAGSGK
ncbi:MAG: hypothetical protein M3Q53_04440 [Actinomycetota bacterium]|nr:hypothetical protein [Actinomycetota bacterium]